MAYISVAYLWHFNIMYYNGDYVYHYSRLLSIKNALSSGHFPLVSQGVKIPYGISLTYYPWLTLIILLPVLLIIHQPVSVFYTIIMISILLCYITSYYSSNTIFKNRGNSFLFAILYTNSSVVFNWWSREGDVGALLALAFLPLAFFGFLSLLKYKRWLMMTSGIILSLTSHVITGSLLILLIIFLAILNPKRIGLKGYIKFVLSLLCIVIITSIFWWPMIKLSIDNSIQMPHRPLEISSGLHGYIGATCNFIYGLTDIVGLLSVFNIRHKRFSKIDFELWLCGLGCILINIKWISHIAITILPALRQLQFTYRFGILSHLIFSYLATLWLIGFMRSKKIKPYRLGIVLLSIIMLFSPIFNEIDYHFLMHDREILRPTNVSVNNPKAYYHEYKRNNKSFKELKYYFYCYDYAPSKQVGQSQLFDLNYKSNVYGTHNNWINTKRYNPVHDGIIINNTFSKDNSIQFPIILYHGIKYQFNLNGHKMPKKYINKKLTWKNYELTLHNLPKGKDKVSIRSASLK